MVELGWDVEYNLAGVWLDKDFRRMARQPRELSPLSMCGRFEYFIFHKLTSSIRSLETPAAEDTRYFETTKSQGNRPPLAHH